MRHLILVIIIIPIIITIRILIVLHHYFKTLQLHTTTPCPPLPLKTMRLSVQSEADQMTAKLQNAEPLMAPDLRVKAMKEAYAGRGARFRAASAAVLLVIG